MRQHSHGSGFPAFLYGIYGDELEVAEFELDDPRPDMVICVRDCELG